MGFNVLEDAKLRVRELATKAGIDFEPTQHGYPHFSFIDDAYPGQWASFDLSGANVHSFTNYNFSSDAEALSAGQSQKTFLNTPQGPVEGTLTCLDLETYRLTVPATKAALTAAWLRDLSDGLTRFDPDITRRIPGPVLVRPVQAGPAPEANGMGIAIEKPYYVGIEKTGTPDGSSPGFPDREGGTGVPRVPRAPPVGGGAPDPREPAGPLRVLPRAVAMFFGVP